MKKIISVLVIVSLLFAACIPAFAGANVDALTDTMQKEVATLILQSIEAGNDCETIKGRSAVKLAVISGIADYTPYKEAYDGGEESIGLIVSLAVTAVRADHEFSESAAAMLTTAVTNAIIEEVDPEATTTEPTKPDVTQGSSAEAPKYIVDFLSNLSYPQIESTLITLVGNQALTVDQAKAVADALKANGTITAEQRDKLYAAVVSPEAGTNAVDKFFEGYTPTDLAQLFRGFGDAIGQMTDALSNLFRGGSSSDEPTTDPNGSGSNPSDIPATGDYAIPAVAAVALVAGLALVLTKKKKDD